jgi:hypothetical protein
MSLFDLDSVVKREEVKPDGVGNDYYPSLGSQYKETTKTYENYESAVKDVKKRLEKANEDADVIDSIIRLLTGPSDQSTIKSFRSTNDLVNKYGTDYSIYDSIEDVVDKKNLDINVSELKDLDNYSREAVVQELEDTRNSIKESFAPDFELYKALNQEQDFRKLSTLLLNSDDSAVVEQVYGSERYTTSSVTESETVVNPSGMPTAPPASAPDASPVIQRSGGSSGMATASLAADPADDPIFGNFGAQADTVTGQQQTEQIEETEETEQPTTDTGTGGSGPSLMQQRAADRSEIQTLLAEQFGGSAFFFEANENGLRIGLTADGAPVAVDDPEAVSEIPIIDYIVNNGITDQSRVLTILQKTEWWQGTDNAMRAFDVTWSQLSEPGRTEYLEPVMDVLDQEAQFLGFELSDDRKYILAKDIARMGESQDSDYIRTKLLDELEYSSMSNDISGFGAARDALQTLAYKYFTPLSDEAANDWAELIYTGEATEIEYEQFLKASAVSHFPTLDKVINEMGITPDQYFQPYKQKIESMLGRQVDMLDEFSDVIEYIPSGTSTSRPMTLSEVSKFVRALPEWQQTDAAKDQAKALSYAIGRTFGEVA